MSDDDFFLAEGCKAQLRKVVFGVKLFSSVEEPLSFVGIRAVIKSPSRSETLNNYCRKYAL